ncbi:MAG: D-sedoheptulose-7-phosphate isomerase [Fimbriiglobus sp.]
MIGATMSPAAFMRKMAEEMTRVNPAEIQALADTVFRAYEAGRFIFVIGNGGSGSNASHFCEDVGKGSLKLPEDLHSDAKKRFRILSLTDNTPYILAWANDEGFDRVFLEQLRNLASPGDVLVAISGSGNSKNILAAVEWANRNGLHTFGITGFSGGKLRGLAHGNLHVDSHDMGVVETVHLAAFHWVVDDMHRRISM